MKIGQDAVVTIAYSVREKGGDLIDSSDETGDFPYLHGHENIVPGLEEALIGKDVGDTVSVTVPPEKGYGLRDEAKVFTVPKSHMPDDEEITVGMEFHAEDRDGSIRQVTVTKVTGDQVTLDANHALAGMTLDFAVEVKAIRAATPDELDHGHVHGEGGHHH